MLAVTTCSYSKRYKAKLPPRCGCDRCAAKFVRKITREIWRKDYDADCEHTVRRVLQLAGVLAAPTT